MSRSEAAVAVGQTWSERWANARAIGLGARTAIVAFGGFAIGYWGLHKLQIAVFSGWPTAWHVTAHPPTVMPDPDEIGEATRRMEVAAHHLGATLRGRSSGPSPSGTAPGAETEGLASWINDLTVQLNDLTVQLKEISSPIISDQRTGAGKSSGGLAP